MAQILSQSYKMPTKVLDEIDENEVVAFLRPSQMKHKLTTFSSPDPSFTMEPWEVDFTDILGEYELKFDEQLPLFHFRLEDKFYLTGTKFLPVYEFSQASGYLVLGEGGIPNRLYKLPAGHYRPHSDPLEDEGVKLCDLVTVNRVGDNWPVFEVPQGYFFHEGEACLLPRGLIITPEEPRPMVAVREFLKLYPDANQQLIWQSCLDEAMDKYVPSVEVSLPMIDF